APRKAITHIHKTAPGPPKAIAVATPAMLPMPTRPDSEMASAWNEDTPACDDLPDSSSRTISGTPRSCMKRVRMEKYRPAPRHSAISALRQIRPLRVSRKASKGGLRWKLVRAGTKALPGRNLPDSPRSGGRCEPPRRSGVAADARNLALLALQLPRHRVRRARVGREQGVHGGHHEQRQQRGEGHARDHHHADGGAAGRARPA